MMLFIVPVLIISLPIITLVVFNVWHSRRTRMQFVIAFTLSCIMGLTFPILATYVSVKMMMHHLSFDDQKCLTGAGVFLFSGFLINAVGVPTTGWLLFPKGSPDEPSRVSHKTM